ncbi:NahK/ErcS family hybrid sensor histidine kinase/response regulator [Pseudomaricurvus sp. HS19]|uniref:hybrid sensor histidine kinase/response regulator n=1 Tax=Pseudomaricurvus sp. HS19 TaxID=2692626 RepID=UPI00136BC1E4|nr:NahK/ErcS family hybrid sensor histidine kinase/response regulator [Pseudomaricurvus sp. HS19]MYM64864.1 response regulator [Pseudomaricurvus sp. HS19]
MQIKETVSSEGQDSVIEALRYENDKLKKINQVLIQRVEQGWGNSAEAYRSFQNAAILADKVKERTFKLRKTLFKLEEANQNLSQTRLESAHSRQRLLDTIENISDAIVLFDRDRKLVLANSHFFEFWKTTDARIEAGLTTYRDLTVLAVKYGIYDQSLQPSEKMVQRGDHHDAVIRLTDGRWLQVSERATADDGLVVAYSDITALKQNEIARQEKVLSDQNRLLQSMISNLPLGVVMVNANNQIESWNGRVIDLLGVQHGYAVRHADFNQLLRDTVLANIDLSVTESVSRGQRDLYERECMLDDGRVIAITCHLIPGGGFVYTFRDVTEQRRTAEALKNAYKHMEKRVHERTLELSELNHQLLVEIEDRTQAERSLLLAKREAETANQSKTRFITAASHDLLQPLNAARLFATALQDFDLPDNVAKLVKSLSFSLNDVETLLGTLVDISKLEAGIVEPIRDNFPVNELLQNLSNEFNQHARREGLEFDFVPSSVNVYSDSQLLARILRNFLTNAIRYTDKGKLLLGCRRRKDCLEIQVWDTGIGIAEDQLQEIFVEFKRLSGQKQREDKGLGLGLAIVDKLSGVLGHEVKLNSILGKGSVFSVCVPYASADYQHSKLSDPGSEFDDPFTGKRILVVDNDKAICQGMSVVLESWGCEVVTAQTLEELRSRRNLLTPAPDVLILDYHLDDDDTGLQAEAIVRRKLKRPVPSLFITANYNNELRQQVKEMGFRLINKPVKPLKLKSVLSFLLSPNNQGQ